MKAVIGTAVWTGVNDFGSAVTQRYELYDDGTVDGFFSAHEIEGEIRIAQVFADLHPQVKDQLTSSL